MPGLPFLRSTRGNDVLMIGQGQLADWEGGYVQTGTVKAGTSTTEFTTDTRTQVSDPDDYNTNGPSRVDRFYSGAGATGDRRLLEFTDNPGGGPAIGEKQLVTNYLMNSPTFTVGTFTTNAFTTTPAVGQAFKIYSIGDQAGAYGDVADGKNYQTVLTFKNSSGDGGQLRAKFSSKEADGSFTQAITLGGAVPDGRDLYIDQLFFGASLGYRMGQGTDHLVSAPGDFLFRWYPITFIKGLIRHPVLRDANGNPLDEKLATGSIFDDAFSMVRWRIEVDGSVYRNYDGQLPASKLHVPGLPYSNQLDSVLFLASSPILGFERMYDGLMTNMLGESIHVPSGATFALKAALTQYNSAVEYDVWARGFYI